MTSRYSRVLTDPAYSSSTRLDTPSYPPPYEAEQPFLQDIEEEAPRRLRARREPLPSFDSDPRFRMRTPSPYARAALLLFLFGTFWLALKMRKAIWLAGGMGTHREGPEVDPSY